MKWIIWIMLIIMGAINAPNIPHEWLYIYGFTIGSMTMTVMFVIKMKARKATMNFNEYQQLAERTANLDLNTQKGERLVNFSFGLMGETGEVIDCLKKILFHGHDLELNQDKLKFELGDCLWYIATLANTTGLKLEDIAIANIEKLKARYPDGFSQERSINRTEGAK